MVVGRRPPVLRVAPQPQLHGAESRRCGMTCEPATANQQSGTSLRWLAGARALLTRRHPAYLTQRRGTTRSAMVLLSLLLVIGTVWLPWPTPFSRDEVLPLLAVTAATWVATLVRPWRPALDRVGGLVVLVEVYLLIAFSGGEDSIYRSLYLGLLVYAALFYDRTRLILSFVLVSVLAFMPSLHTGVFETVTLSALIVEVGMWFIVAITVYTLTERLRRSASRDGLTGLINHATFWQVVEGAHERFERYGRPYSVLLVDIDHFKQVNDSHGHRAGDRVLKQVADLLGSRVRSADVVARYGGEEFTILLSETTKSQAALVAEDLRRAVDQADIVPHTTVSIGVACSDDAIASAAADMLVEAADQGMYAAKRAGRNRVSLTPCP